METYVAIRQLYKPISKDIAPVIRTDITVSTINFGDEVNLKVLMYLVLSELKA